MRRSSSKVSGLHSQSRRPSAGILPVALRAVLRHDLPFWDAMLWATVQQAGCRVLLTEDFQDGRKLGSVTFINPFEPGNAAVLDRALSPIAS